ncbi:flagellar hook-length control protein FliK [Hahella sp. KA22]|uniref:flagellar hook-length control protein FliK n=1 Tax=Hahella sp. KA22 TaxID=1628392 RepID=UPI000FDE06E0|nr:flagellar hook-length control protein FliK [Hahella sp. KA22]AZZ93256.1 flagellar hook-length control protein FliK [Hahella sp. KA22]QAY56630.1 flagellar hook-length control protein FliK [Hahella sp. KA22]
MKVQPDAAAAPTRTNSLPPKIQAELSAIVQKVGNLFSARITDISPSPSTATPNPTPNAQTSATPSWRLILSAEGLPQPLQTDIRTAQLPQDWLVGKVLQLQVTALGLKVVDSLAPPQTEPTQALLATTLQTLSKWLPLQGDLRHNLEALVRLSSDTRLPRDLAQTLDKLNQALPTPPRVSEAGGLKQAIQQSGAGLERHLLRTLAENRGPAPDKAALPSSAEPRLLSAAPQDIKALLTVALGATLAQLNRLPNSALPANWEQLVSWLTRQTAEQPGMATGGHPLQFPPPMGREGGRPPLPANLDAGEMLRALAQATARLHSHQLNALQQNLSAGPDQTGAQVWFVEVPVAAPRMDSIQMRFEKEQRSGAKDNKKSRWKIVLAFDLEGLGPMQSQVLYTEGTVSATFWAMEQKTLGLVTEELPRLRKGLQDWGLEVGDLAVRKGAPPTPSAPISRQLIDERA